MTRSPIYFFIFQQHSVFIPLKYVYPECFVLIEPHPQISPLQCFNTSCSANRNCAEILAKRVNYLFNNVMPTGKMMYLYFKYKDRPNSIRAGIFTKELSEPTTKILNPYAFKKFQREGISYEWMPTDDFLFISGSGGILPVGNLLKNINE